MTRRWSDALAPALVLALAATCSSSPSPAPDAAAVDATVDQGRPPGDTVVADHQPPADVAPPPADLPPAADGGNNAECNDLARRYAEQFALAKRCDPVLALPQCTVEVDSELACPCRTYVDAANTAAVAELAQLVQSWNQIGCVTTGCPPMPCNPPSKDNCQPTMGSNQGSCQD